MINYVIESLFLPVIWVVVPLSEIKSHTYDAHLYGAASETIYPFHDIALDEIATH